MFEMQKFDVHLSATRDVLFAIGHLFFLSFLLLFEKDEREGGKRTYPWEREKKESVGRKFLESEFDGLFGGVCTFLRMKLMKGGGLGRFAPPSSKLLNLELALYVCILEVNTS